LKVLILGAHGFLGQAILKYTKEESGRFLVLPETQKFKKESQVKTLFQNVKPQVVINCMAITNMQDCERDPKKAFWVNGELPGVVAKYCKGTSSKFIHISTDAVMDTKKAFKCETEPPSPDTTYGLSKLHGENEITNYDSSALICRVNFFGLSGKGKSLLNFFWHSISLNEKVPGYDDVFFTPMGITSTIRIIFDLNRKNMGGIIHLTGNSRISKYEFGKEVEKLMNSTSNVVMRQKHFTGSNSATRDLSLCNCKLRGYLGNVPDWKKDLRLELAKGQNLDEN